MRKRQNRWPDAPSRARAFIPGAVQYSFLLYHPMYFIMYGSIYGKGVRKRSHRAAHVPKWHLLEKAIPLFLPLQIPQTQFYKVVHDYTIDEESLVFSRIFRTWLRCILQGKTRHHKFESFSRCQMKGNPAVVETAGFLVVSRGLRIFDIKLIGSFAAFLVRSGTRFSCVFTHGFTHEKRT